MMSGVDINDQNVDDKTLHETTHNGVVNGFPIAKPKTDVSYERSLDAKETPSFQNRIDIIRRWSVIKLKFTKRLFQEKMGIVTRTVDVELQCKIEKFRETQLKYRNLLQTVQLLKKNLFESVDIQRNFGYELSQLAQRQSALHDSLSSNGEVQKHLSRSCESLTKAVDVFISALDTLVNKAMEDTAESIKTMEEARVTSDAFSSELASYLVAGTEGGPKKKSVSAARLDEAKRDAEYYFSKYKNFVDIVDVKLTLLEDNKNRVLRKHLALIYKAMSSHYVGELSGLTDVMQQFSINDEQEDIS